MTNFSHSENSRKENNLQFEDNFQISRSRISIGCVKLQASCHFSQLDIKMNVSKVNLILGLSFEQNQTKISDFRDENVTSEVLEEVLQLNNHFKRIIDILLVIILVIIMLAMGCEITWNEVRPDLYILISNFSSANN